MKKVVFKYRVFMAKDVSLPKCVLWFPAFWLQEIL